MPSSPQLHLTLNTVYLEPTLILSKPSPLLNLLFVPPPCFGRQTPVPPEDRPMLDQAVAIIDDLNSHDPSRVTVDGNPTPYRWVQGRGPVVHH